MSDTSPPWQMTKLLAGKSNSRETIDMSPSRRRIICSSEGQSIPGIRNTERINGPSTSGLPIVSGESSLWQEQDFVLVIMVRQRFGVSGGVGRWVAP